MAFILIQEGGSSTELYVHAWETREEAEQDREDCENDGSYRTSEVMEVPDALANTPGFYEAVEGALQLLQTLGFPNE